MKLLLTSRNMKTVYEMCYHMKNLTYLKQVYTSQSNHIKFENPKIFTTFEKIHRSFISNLKSDETKVR